MLEKILQEIRKKAQELSKKHWGDDEWHLVGKGIECMCVQVEEIIRSHMEDDGWIPCSPDTMPNDREDVLILWGSENRSTAYYVSGGAGGWFFNYGFDYKWSNRVPYEPYAWQPLPAPPLEGGKLKLVQSGVTAKRQSLRSTPHV